MQSKNTIVFEIDLAGTGTTYAVDIEADSMIPQEREVLIFPYSGFEVTSTPAQRNDVKTYVGLRTCDTRHVSPARW